MRGLDLSNPDGGAAQYIEEIAAKIGAEIEWEERSLDPVYEAARRILEAEKHGKILVFKATGMRYLFAANLVPSRGVLYRLLDAETDSEAYERLRHAEAGKGRLNEKPFSNYFEEAGKGLDLLPALRFYEQDGGRYITSGIFVACRDRVCNASIHRIMVGENYAAVRVVPRHLYSLLQEAPSGLPVAISIGVDPRIALAAALSPPMGVFELEIGASLVGGTLSICSTPLYSLPVPCGSSMVIEARLGPERAPEGPFTDLLGLYDTVRNEPVLHVDAVYLNKVYTPYMHVILPGGIEHMLLMGFPREASIYAAVSRAVPRVSKVRLTPGGGMWLHAVVSITKSHDGDGKTAGFAALAAHPSLKHVVVVDDDIDPDDPRSVEWAIATRLQASRGVVVVPHARGSTLDPSASDGLTDKLIIDATAPIRERGKYRRPRIPG